jgi:hypothetical protein
VRRFFIWVFGCVACGIVGGLTAMMFLRAAVYSWHINDYFWIGFVGGAPVPSAARGFGWHHRGDAGRRRILSWNTTEPPVF